MEKVLIVDDDTNLLAGLERHLRKYFDVSTAEGGEQALDLVKSDGPFAVTVCDMRMPGMNGVEVLAAVKELARDTVRIMLTGYADDVTTTRAVNDGAIFRFFAKPCPPETLAKGIEAGIEQYRLVTAGRELLSGTFSGAVKVLNDLLSMVDPQGFDRSGTVPGSAHGVAVHLGSPNPWQLETAEMLSRIGQVAVPPELLAKKRAGEPLTEVEQEIIALQSGAPACPSKRAGGEAEFEIDYQPRLPTTRKPAYSKDRNWEYLQTTKEGKNLTDRQAQILQKLARGHTNKAIAEHLGLSVHTVRLHVSAILRVLDVSNRTQAALIARELLRQGKAA
ncbi:MAG: response regulator [Rhodospirillales bacterium]